MEVKAVIFCEGQINISDSELVSKPAVINPTFSFRLKYLPSAFSFGIFLMTQGLPDKEMSMRITLKEPESEKIVMDTSSVLPANIESPKGISRDIAGLNINAQVANIPFEKEGLYECSVYIDGILKHQSALYIDKDPTI